MRRLKLGRILDVNAGAVMHRLQFVGRMIAIHVWAVMTRLIASGGPFCAEYSGSMLMCQSIEVHVLTKVDRLSWMRMRGTHSTTVKFMKRHRFWAPWTISDRRFWGSGPPPPLILTHIIIDPL